MPSDAEQADLDKLLKEQASIRDNFFSLGREILRMDDIALRTIGQRTIEGAIKSNFESTLKECDKLAKAHVRKWPDDIDFG